MLHVVSTTVLTYQLWAKAIAETKKVGVRKVQIFFWELHMHPVPAPDHEKWAGTDFFRAGKKWKIPRETVLTYEEVGEK